MKCPGCGKSVTASHECVHHDTRKGFAVRLTHSLPPSVGGGLIHYRLRVVDTIPAFIETIRIFDAGLNDAVVAMCKRTILREDATVGKGALLQFLTIDDEDFLRFTAVGPATPGRYVTYARADYEVACGELHDLLARAEQKGAWLKVDETWLNRFFLSRRSL